MVKGISKWKLLVDWDKNFMGKIECKKFSFQNVHEWNIVEASGEWMKKVC